MSNFRFEFTDDQLHRIDEVYKHVIELCTFLTDGKFDQSDLTTYGPLADDIAEILTKAGYEVHFPTHMVDGTLEAISDYFIV